MEKAPKIGLYITANKNIYITKIENNVVEETINFKYNPKEYIDFSTFLNLHLQRALEEFKVRKEPYLYLSLSSQFVIIRFFELPLFSKKEVIEAVPFETEKRIPFKLKELLWDFKFRIFKKEKTSEICFAGMNKEDYLKITEGIKPLPIHLVNAEPAIISFWRLLFLKREKMMQKLRTYGLILIDDEEANFLLLNNHFPCISRDIKISKAEDLKRFTEEIRLALEYYQRRYKGEFIQNVLFVGKEHYKEYFEELNKEFDLSLYFIPEDKITTQNISLEEAKSYAGTIPARAKILISFNFLKSKKIEKKKEKEKLVPPFRKEYLTISYLVASLIIGINFAVKFNTLKNKQKVLERLERKLLREKNVDISKTAEEFENEKWRLKKIEILLQKYFSNKNVFSELLEKVAILLPKGVWIERLLVSSENENSISLQLEGYSFAKEEFRQIELIKKFVENMRKKLGEHFENINLKELSMCTYQDYKVTKFEVICK